MSFHQGSPTCRRPLRQTFAPRSKGGAAMVDPKFPVAIVAAGGAANKTFELP